jgi:hypothetical protein
VGRGGGLPGEAPDSLSSAAATGRRAGAAPRGVGGGPKVAHYYTIAGAPLPGPRVRSQNRSRRRGPAHSRSHSHATDARVSLRSELLGLPREGLTRVLFCAPAGTDSKTRECQVAKVRLTAPRVIRYKVFN